MLKNAEDYCLNVLTQFINLYNMYSQNYHYSTHERVLFCMSDICYFEEFDEQKTAAVRVTTTETPIVLYLTTFNCFNFLNKPEKPEKKGK